MTLLELTNQISGFSNWNVPEKIELFGWFLLSIEKRETFSLGDIRRCFDYLHEASPANPSSALRRLDAQKRLIRRNGGYVLERSIREELEVKYGRRTATIVVHQLLAELPLKVADLAERTYLDEAITCFKAGAFRASIVMAWNLVYSHFCDLIYAKHLSTFNAAIPLRYANDKNLKPIVDRGDFGEGFKEFQVLQIADKAGVIGKNLREILEAKLKTRNHAAHATGVAFDQLSAEEYIRSIIVNGLMKL